MKKYLNVPFKTVKGHELCADFYIPDQEKNPPIIMWIHGGGWENLNRKWCLVYPQIERGYAVCSVDYRYSDEVVFPGQMLDLKDALIFVKKNGKLYGYDETKVIVSGDSAGGHLCSLLGVSEGNKEWEKEKEDYSVQAVVDFCGPCNLGKLADKECESLNILSRFLGVSSEKKTINGKAAMASPDTYINGKEPPFLILHGSIDPTVAPEQSKILRNALEAVGVPVHMYLVPGGVHGLSGNLLDSIIQEFLDYYIKGKTTVITPQLTKEHDRTIPVVSR